MKINNKEFCEFNAEVVSFSPSVFEINNNISIPESSYLPIIGLRQLVTSTRELVVNFETEEDIGDFTVEAMETGTLDLGDGFIYKIWLKESPDISQDGFESYTVTYSFYVLKQKPLLEITDADFIIEGKVSTAYALEILSTEDKQDITVNGYVIKLLKANDTFVIDGITKKVFYTSNPGVSEFDNVSNLFLFPIFEPGPFKVESSDDSILFKIRYYPTFM